MAPLALALQLALASSAVVPPVNGPAALSPRLDPGPFRGSELAMGSVGAFAGDLLVVGAGYLTLQLFASDAVSPNAANFRRAAYVLGGAALLVPPLSAALLAKLTGRGPAAGAFWKAALLATAGHALSLAVAYAAAPRFYLVLPVQLAAVSAGASLGLHWGPRGRGAGPVSRPVERARDGAGEEVRVALFTPLCPDR